ncbi:sulfatase [Candidatus Hydrogenedentota bacterium]
MPKKNFILIALDTLRAEQMSSYGYHVPTSPNMDMMGAQGLQFKNAYSEARCTHPSFTTMLTGVHCLSHRVVTHCGRIKKHEEYPMVGEYLQEAGVKTVAIDNLASTWHSWVPETEMVVEPLWFTEGFDTYDDYGLLKQTSLKTKKNAGELVDKAYEHLKALKDDSFFMFLHTWDPHTGYFPPPPFDKVFYARDEKDPKYTSMVKAREDMGTTIDDWHGGSTVDVTDADWFIAQYDGAIAYTDYQMGRLRIMLQELGIAEDTTILITADHGENMLEHLPYFGHGGLWDKCLRVPMIAYRPGDEAQPKASDAIASHIDIVPTILNHFGVEIPEHMHGFDLFDLAAGNVEGREWAYSMTDGEVGAHNGRYHLMAPYDDTADSPEGKEFYDLVEDPDEQNNIAAEKWEIAGPMFKQLAEYMRNTLAEAGHDHPWIEEWDLLSKARAARKK